MAIKIINDCPCCGGSNTCKLYVNCGCNGISCGDIILNQNFTGCLSQFPSQVTMSRVTRLPEYSSDCECGKVSNLNGVGSSNSIVWRGTFTISSFQSCGSFCFQVEITFRCDTDTWVIRYYGGSACIGPTFMQKEHVGTCDVDGNGNPGFILSLDENDITLVYSCFDCTSFSGSGNFGGSALSTISVGCCENLLPETLTGTITNVSGCSGFTEGQTIEFSYAGSSEWRANNIGISCKSAGFSNWSLTCSGLSSSDFTLSMNHTFTNCSIAPIAPDVSLCSPINLVFLCDVPLCQCCNPAEDATFTLTITA